MTVSVRLEPMTEAEFADYASGAEAEYAVEIIASGSLPEHEARSKAAADFAELLPLGLATVDQLLWTAYDGATRVGMLWIGLSETSAGRSAYIYDIEVRAESRGQGYGRALMAACEEVCRDRGAVSIGLNVFGNNHVARSLYEQLGFETTSMRMRKQLT